MPRITENLMSKIERPSKGQKFIRDDKLIGFGVRVTPGCSTYIVEGRVRGSGVSRRITIGKRGRLTTAAARRLAKRIIGDMACGIDPVIRRRDDSVRKVTLGEVRDKYLGVRTMSKHGRKMYVGLFDRCLADWLHTPIVEITKDMIEERHAELTRTTRFGTDGKCQANCAMQCLNTLFRFAINYYEKSNGEPVLIRNPVVRLTQIEQWHRIPRRQTVIADRDLHAWYAALSGLRPKIRDYLLLILMTGMRRMEAAQLKFESIDWMRKIVTISGKTTKNGKTYQLPLTPFIFELLLRRKSESIGSEYVFPGQGGRGHLVDPYLDNARAATTFKWTVHDLRRTFITACDRVGIRAEQIKRLVNHATGADVTAGYIVADVEDLRVPLTKVNEHLLVALGLMDKHTE